MRRFPHLAWASACCILAGGGSLRAQDVSEESVRPVIEQFRAMWAKKPCGDHSILSNPKVIASLDHQCASNIDAENDVTRRLIETLDAGGEAARALARREFRIGTISFDAPRRAGQLPWDTPGVRCTNLSTTQIVNFSGSTDTPSPSRSRLQQSTWLFLSKYNGALVSGKSFPRSISCQPL